MASSVAGKRPARFTLGAPAKHLNLNLMRLGTTANFRLCLLASKI
jgi:hypothetical protein